MRDCVAAIRDAFIQLSGGEITAPQRLVMPTNPDDGLLLLMPAFAANKQQSTVKLVRITNSNSARNLPYIQATVMLFDATTGQLLAIMDGETITAMRTGAASGAATDAMARKAAKTLAIFGTGAQAESQLDGVCAVRSIEKMLVFGRNPNRTADFANRMQQKFNIDVRVATAPEQLREADIICTATTATSPVFADEHVAPGTHINGVGAYKPHMQEVPPETVQRARIAIDEREAALSEAGDLLIPLNAGQISESHFLAEIGDVFSGKIPGRQSENEITFFKSVGHAAQDLALASQVWAAAQSLNLGKNISL